MRLKEFEIPLSEGFYIAVEMIKSTKAIKLAKAVPTLPTPPNRPGRSEIQQVEAFIRSVGGRPMTQVTKHGLAKAGCRGFPED
jgi:hypothetical protein